MSRKVMFKSSGSMTSVKAITKLTLTIALCTITAKPKWKRWKVSRMKVKLTCGDCFTEIDKCLFISAVIE